MTLSVVKLGDAAVFNETRAARLVNYDRQQAKCFA